LIGRGRSARESRTPAAFEEDEVQLHYTVIGTGPPLIALHGFGATSYAWRYLAPALAERHRLYLVDLKGHGASPRPDDGHYSLDDNAALVQKIIQANDLRRVVLIGNSLGGGVALMVALRLAMDDSNRIAAIVLIDSTYIMKVPLIIKLLRTPVIGTIAISMLPARLSVRLALSYITMNRKWITPDVLDAYSANLLLPGGKAALIQTARQGELRNVDKLINKVRRLDVPTLIIWGREDPLIDLSVGKRLKADIHNSRLCVIDACGHLPHEEKPDIVLSAVNEFETTLI
jgi:pimeloyl-ACP methyl ester carboxylesterase